MERCGRADNESTDVDESGLRRRSSGAQGMIGWLAEGKIKERGRGSMDVEESSGSRKPSGVADGPGEHNRRDS